MPSLVAFNDHFSAHTRYNIRAYIQKATQHEPEVYIWPPKEVALSFNSPLNVNKVLYEILQSGLH